MHVTLHMATSPHEGFLLLDGGMLFLLLLIVLSDVTATSSACDVTATSSACDVTATSSACDVTATSSACDVTSTSSACVMELASVSNTNVYNHDRIASCHMIS